MDDQRCKDDAALVREALVYFGGGEPEGFTPGTLAPLAFAALERLAKAATKAAS